MAKKSAAQTLKDLVTGKSTLKNQNSSKGPLKPSLTHSTNTQENYKTGIKGRKVAVNDPDSVVGKFENRLKANGLTLKIESAHHFNVTVSKETPDHSAQFSVQVNGGFTQNDADELYSRAVTELLGE